MNEKYILKDNFEIVCYDDISILVKKDIRINFYKCKSLIIIEYKKIRCSNT